MRIDVTNVVVGVGIGALDEVLERQDAENARTESFKTWTDWGRVGITALGLMGQAFNFFPKISTAMAQSGLPLATKSVAKVLLKSEAPAPAPMERGVRRTMTSTPGGGVMWKPKAIGD